MTDEDRVNFTPDFSDNRDLPDEEQIWLEILPMTAEEIRSYQRSMATVKANSREAFERAGKVVSRILKDRVLAIHNYTDIKGFSISNGEELYARGEPGMIDAAYEGLTEISTLKRGLRKN
tara:strand:+ start:45 stop:404 length:360 start_codon:yes stop_codon:yes gene_type:complete